MSWVGGVLLSILAGVGLFRRSKRSAAERSADDTFAALAKEQDISFFSPGELNQFGVELSASIDRLGIQDARFHRKGFLVVGGNRYLLEQLGRTCHGSPPEMWPAILDDFFASQTH